MGEDARFARLRMLEKIPVLYDMLAGQTRVWPVSFARWGGMVDAASSDYTIERLYFAEKTDGSDPNAIAVCNANVYLPGEFAPTELATFVNDRQSQHFRHLGRFQHPGEVNAMQKLGKSNSILVTASSSPNVFVWDASEDALRSAEAKANGRSAARRGRVVTMQPLCHLRGLKKEIDFALTSASNSAHVASGCQGGVVCVWDVSGAPLKEQALAHYMDPLVSLRVGDSAIAACQFGKGERETDFVYALSEDEGMTMWDLRSGQVSFQADQAPNDEYYVVDSHPTMDHLIATGSKSGVIRLHDIRKPGAFLYEGALHRAPLTCVQWADEYPSVLAAGDEDGAVQMIDFTRTGDQQDPCDVRVGPPELVFFHRGHHTYVSSLDFLKGGKLAVLTASDHSASGGGGSIQIWRPRMEMFRSDIDIESEFDEACSADQRVLSVLGGSWPRATASATREFPLEQPL